MLFFALSVALTDVLQSIESIVASIVHMPMTKHVGFLRTGGVLLGSTLLAFIWTARQLLQSILFSAVPACLLVIQRVANRPNATCSRVTYLEFTLDNMIITLAGREVNEESVNQLDFAVFLTGLVVIDVTRRLVVSQTTATAPRGKTGCVQVHELARAFPMEVSPITPPRVRERASSTSPDRFTATPPTPCTGNPVVNNRYFFDASEGDIEIKDKEIPSWSLISPQSTITEGDAVDASALHVAMWSLSPGTPAAHVVTPLMVIEHPSAHPSLGMTSIGRKLQTRKMRIRTSLDGHEKTAITASTVTTHGPGASSSSSSFAIDQMESVAKAVVMPVQANLADAADFMADCTRAIESFVPISEVAVVPPKPSQSHQYHSHHHYKNHAVGVKISEPDDDDYDLRSGRTSIESSASMSLSMSSVDEAERKGKGTYVHNHNTRSARNSIDLGVVE